MTLQKAQEKGTFRLRKTEILSGNIEIKRLFENGIAFGQPGFKTFFCIYPAENNERIKILFASPKKLNRLAVTRNRQKRLMREAYRKNKHLIEQTVEKFNCNILIAFISATAGQLTYSYIENKIIVSLQRISKTIEHNFQCNENKNTESK